MVARILFFSDTHLGFDYPVRTSGRSSRRRGGQFFENFESALEHGASNCDLIIHGGDFFHRSQPHPVVTDRAYMTLAAAASAGPPIVIVPGNHERSVLPPSLWLAHPNLYIVDRPRALSFDVGDQTIEIVGVPNIREARGAIRRALEGVERTAGADYRILVIHQAVDGSTVGPSDFTFRYRADTVARAELKGFDVVLSGHIHRHQILAGAPPVIHCGSTERTSRAELAEQKGFCTIELMATPATITDGVAFHPLPMTPIPDNPWRHRPASDDGDAVAPAQPLDYDDLDRALSR